MTPLVPFKLGTFSSAGSRAFPGLVLDDRVLAVGALGACRGETLLELLDEWDTNFEVLREKAAAIAGGQAPELDRLRVPVSELRVHAPVPEPRTVYCSGANYKRHVVDLIIAHSDQPETQAMTPEQKREWGTRLMDERAASGTPFVFIKPQSSVTGPDRKSVV